jgi:hypothetical protein
MPACITHAFVRNKLSLQGLQLAAEGRLLEVKAKAWSAASVDATSSLEASSSYLFSYGVGIVVKTIT